MSSTRSIGNTGARIELPLSNRSVAAGGAASNVTSRPVSDACLMASTRRCRSTAVSKVGWRLSPPRIASSEQRVHLTDVEGLA